MEVQTDSSALAALEGDQKDLAATFADLNQVAEYNTAFMDLESGACDAIAMDIGVQKTLDEMAEDGTVDKIAEKYADYGVPGALCIGKNGK